MDDLAIHVSKLTKCFGDVVAVNDLTLQVKPGSTCALLGGNGAGKTTTLSMLLGLLLPDSGSIKILGHDISKHRYQVLPRMNFTSPYVDLPMRLSVYENLMVYARLYNVRNAKQVIQGFAEELGFTAFLQRAFSSLSSGQKTRVALAKSLLNEPALLLLDEPTASMDPDTGDRIRSYLQAYQQRSGATLLLASHNMLEVERLCDQVVILRAGEVVAGGTPDKLIAEHGRETLEQVFLDVARHEGKYAQDENSWEASL